MEAAAVIRRTNEVPGTRAKLRNLPTSAYKVREVLDLVRGKPVDEALAILRFSNRGPAVPVAKLLSSAIANAENNDDLQRDELFVAACFADEGVTAKRWRPRARGRAGRIRKRTSHITIVVRRLPEDRLERLRAEQAKEQGGRRRRVAGSRAARVAGGRRRKAEGTEDVAEASATESVVESATDETDTTAITETEVSSAVDDDAATETKEEGK